MKQLTILHFVTGGFSGATKVAIDLVCSHNSMANVKTILILRKKKTTTPDKLAELREKNIEFYLVSSDTHISTIYQLKKLFLNLQPDIIVAHGFPEHLLGRWAAIWAKVPNLIQVEHNSRERYTVWKLAQSRFLSRYTKLIIGVSEGVANILTQQGLNAPIIAIPNGIDTLKFRANNTENIKERHNDLIMVARYARSKDHITLIKALNILKNQGLRPKLTLVGSGRKYYQNQVKSLIKLYGLENQINFIEYTDRVAQLLQSSKIFIMSSRFEGLNLSVLEAMASGCLVIGSDALGVKELINDKQDGFIFPIGDYQKLACILADTLNNLTKYQPFTERAKHKILSHYDKANVSRKYYEVFKMVANNGNNDGQ